MADINLHHIHRTPAQDATSLTHAAFQGLRAWTARFAAARARRRLRRDTARQLAALNDRTLQDIGIPRGAIWTVADDLVNAVSDDGRPTTQPGNSRRQ